MLSGFSGCLFPPRVYKLDVEQGNPIEDKAKDKLKIGQTKYQVRDILGVSLTENAFDNDQWDYYYWFKEGNGPKRVEQHIILHFKQGKLNEIHTVK